MTAEETVARAIYRWKHRGAPWKRVPESKKEIYRRQAKAALGAYFAFLRRAPKADLLPGARRVKP